MIHRSLLDMQCLSLYVSRSRVLLPNTNASGRRFISRHTIKELHKANTTNTDNAIFADAYNQDHSHAKKLVTTPSEETNTDLGSPGTTHDKLQALLQRLEPMAHELNELNKEKTISESMKMSMNLLMKIANRDIELSDSTEAWDRSKRHKTLSALPPIPKSYRNEETFTKYIKELCEVQTNMNPKIYETVEAIILKFIESYRFSSVETYNHMISFLTSNYRIPTANILLGSIYKNDLKPDIDTINYMLSPMPSTVVKPHLLQINKYLLTIENLQLTPNKSTVYILLSLLSRFDKQVFTRYYRLLQNRGILGPNELRVESSMNRISMVNTLGELEFEALEFIKDCKTNKTRIQSHITGEIISGFLRFKSPEKAWLFISENRSVVDVNMNALFKFVKYFADKHEIYNSIAMINLFAENKLTYTKPLKAYSILAQSMIDYPYFPNWYLCVRSFIYDTKLSSTSGTMISNFHMEQLQQKAALNLNREVQLHSISRLEMNEIQEIFNRLTWPDNHPKFDLMSNHHEFIEAAMTIGAIPTASAI